MYNGCASNCRPQVLLACGGSIWQLDELGVVEHPLPPPPSSSRPGLSPSSSAPALTLTGGAHSAPLITHLAVSPGGVFVAVLTASGRLTVWAAGGCRGWGGCVGERGRVRWLFMRVC